VDTRAAPALPSETSGPDATHPEEVRTDGCHGDERCARARGFRYPPQLRGRRLTLPHGRGAAPFEGFFR